MYLLRAVEIYLRRTGTRPTTFGRTVVHDPQFVFDLRRGREPRESTEQRVRAFIAQQEEAQG